MPITNLLSIILSEVRESFALLAVTIMAAPPWTKTGIPLSDLTSGFKGIRKTVLENLDFDKIDAEGYGFQIEIHFYTYKKGFKIKEVPIVFTERRSGNSKMSKKIIWEAFWLVWKLGLRRLTKKI